MKEDPRTRDEPPARPALGRVAVLFAFCARPIDIPLVRRRGLRTHAIVVRPIEVSRAAAALGRVLVV